jgi:hypothetical protein
MSVSDLVPFTLAPPADCPVLGRTQVLSIEFNPGECPLSLRADQISQGLANGTQFRTAPFDQPPTNSIPTRTAPALSNPLQTEGDTGRRNNRPETLCSLRLRLPAPGILQPRLPWLSTRAMRDLRQLAIAQTVETGSQYTPPSKVG